MFAKVKYVLFFMILILSISGIGIESGTNTDNRDFEVLDSVNYSDFKFIQNPDSTVFTLIDENDSIDSVKTDICKKKSSKYVSKEIKNVSQEISFFSFTINLLHQMFRYIF